MMRDKEKAAQAQEKYCAERGLPDFVGDGHCFWCRENIFEASAYGTRSGGYTVEEAGRRLITSCPHCNHSFVE